MVNLNLDPTPLVLAADASSPQPGVQSVPNNLITLVQPSLPPPAIVLPLPSTPTPTHTPTPTGADPLKYGLSPRPKPSSRLAVHTEIPQPTQNVHALSNSTSVPPGRDGLTDSAVEPEYLTARPPRSRALLIGVHYKNSPTGWGMLDTPGRDVINMRKLLRSRGYAQFRTLVDTNDRERYAMPTEAEIRNGLHWLIDDARPGDKLFLHYSGHGDQQPTDDSSESDFMNEAIVVPTSIGGPEALIIDNELHAILVKPLPYECVLMAVFDCCHSGTMLDLSHNYPQGGITRRNLKTRWMKECASRFIRPIRQVHSLPSLAMRHRAPTIETPAPVVQPTQRGTVGSLNFPSALNPLTPPGSPTEEPPSPRPFGDLRRGSTPVQSLMCSPSNSVLFDEPRGTDSRKSTQNSMQVHAPSKHTTISSPLSTGGSGGTGSVRWFAGDSLTSTPMTATFKHEKTIVPPIVRDFQTQTRAHTHVRSPTIEEPDRPRAKIIAIAACHDEELAVELYKGGLLTSTFIDCMRHPAHAEGIPLANLISCLRESFKSKVRWLHEGCPAPKEGKCECEMPLKAPEPLVTSSMKLMGDAHIML